MSIREHTSVEVQAGAVAVIQLHLHTPTYVSIRQHTAAYVSIRQYTSVEVQGGAVAVIQLHLHTAAYVSIRQHTAAYVSIRQHTAACVAVIQVHRVVAGGRRRTRAPHHLHPQHT